MKNKILILITFVLSLIIFILVTLPLLTFKSNNKITIIFYNDDISKYEDYFCYNESYAYNGEMDVSLSSFEMKKRSIFYIITFEYKPGNICDTEYYLELSYIENVIENAKFIYNSHNLNLKEIIKDKEPIVGNILYLGNDYTISIDYKLKDKYETMYIFYKDDLLIFQIGHRDEGTKFISYR